MIVAEVVAVVAAVAVAAVVAAAVVAVVVAAVPFASGPLESRFPGTETPVASQSVDLSTREHSIWRNGASAARRSVPSSTLKAWL